MDKNDIRRIQEYDLMFREEVRKAEKVKLSCDHRKPNGRPSLVSGNESDTMRCTICNSKVSFKKVKRDQFEGAVELVKEVIQSLKVMDPDISKKLLESLSNTLMNLDVLPKYYYKIYDEYISDRGRRDEGDEYDRFRDRPEMGGRFYQNPKYGYGGKRNRDDDDDEYRRNKDRRRYRDNDDDDDNDF